MKYHEIKSLSRQLRKEQTDAEAILWQEVRNRRFDGKKFTRQFPIIYESNGCEHFFYIADFYCYEHKLIIELDGKIHEFQKDHDVKRDEILTSLGYNVLRLKNEELVNLELVKNKIREYFI